MTYSAHRLMALPFPRERAARIAPVGARQALMDFDRKARVGLVADALALFHPGLSFTPTELAMIVAHQVCPPATRIAHVLRVHRVSAAFEVIDCMRGKPLPEELCLGELRRLNRAWCDWREGGLLIGEQEPFETIFDDENEDRRSDAEKKEDDELVAQLKQSLRATAYALTALPPVEAAFKLFFFLTAFGEVFQADNTETAWLAMQAQLALGGIRPLRVTPEALPLLRDVLRFVSREERPSVLFDLLLLQLEHDHPALPAW